MTFAALFTLPDFPEYIKLFGYLGIFLFFVTVDQITFIPEEITLLTIGYLASHGIFNPYIAGLVSLLAFLAVDSVYFTLTKKGRKLTTRLHKKMGSNLQWVEEKLKTNFPKTLFVLCFIPRMRLWAPIISGALNIPYRKFLVYDALSLATFTGIYIALGVIFHNGLQSVLHKLETMQHLIFSAFILLVGIGIFIGIRKFSKAKQKEQVS